MLAVDGITCEFRAGEIHALLGENGAGKTTLMRILTGYYKPNYGSIAIDGTELSFHGPRDARRAGIAMVHQNFTLIPELTVAENLALGSSESTRLLHPRRWIEHLKERSEAMGFDVRPEVPIWATSMGERQRLEVFRLVLEGARVLVLDEPTSILAPAEAERLFKHLRDFAQAGHVVVLVTHKLDHVLAVADWVTILRRGRVASTRELLGLSAADLAQLVAIDKEVITGHQLPPVSDTIVLDARLDRVPPRVSPTGLVDVSIRVCAGELVGVAGISGNGQDELVAALVGLSRYKGHVQFLGKATRRNRPACLAYIPVDRRRLGAAISLRIQDNLALRHYKNPPFSIGPFLVERELRRDAQQKIERFGISPQNPDMQAAKLSGGNLQKLILARELSHQADLIIAEQPTAGLDVATSTFVRNQLLSVAGSGVGVLVVSEDIDDLLSMCHRIVVLHHGKIVAEFPARQQYRQNISLAMSGLLSKSDV